MNYYHGSVGRMINKEKDDWIALRFHMLLSHWLEMKNLQRVLASEEDLLNKSHCHSTAHGSP